MDIDDWNECYTNGLHDRFYGDIEEPEDIEVDDIDLED